MYRLLIFLFLNYNLILAINEKEPCNNSSDLSLIKLGNDKKPDGRILVEITSQNHKNKNNRLPKTIKPSEYSLELATFFDEENDRNFTFEGVAKIEIIIKETTQNINFHSESLKIKNVILKNDDQAMIELSKLQHDEQMNLSMIIAREKLNPGNYSFEISYEGKIRDDPSGFSKNSYLNESGKKVWFGATHFEPIGARRVFPCFDEPEYKAVFNLKINHHKKFHVVSNTKVRSKSTPDKNSRVTTSFETTPKMSTYLLAFAISDFSSITNNVTGHKVYARSNAIQQASFALEIEDKIMKKLEEITKVSYALDKMDFIAVPEYYSVGMEHWGAIFLRENSLLRDKNLTNTADKVNTAIYISHEYAHQWFGNLVTCKWWNDLWLNEAFAYYLGVEITKEVLPQWISLTHLASFAELDYLFEYDAHASIILPVATKLLNSVESHSAYRTENMKGAFVLQMMEHFLTKIVFRKGLTAFLKKYAYSVAETNDFLEVMQNVVNEENYNLTYDLKTIMDSWVYREGYPILHVIRNYETQKVKIKQERFFSKLYTTAEDRNSSNYTWYIPINYATQTKLDFNNTIADFWLTNSSVEVSIPADLNQWLLLNKQQTGLYRVNYDEKNWKLLTDYLKTSNRSKIFVQNRVQLMIDVLKFYEFDMLGLYLVLNSIDGLAYETDHAVLKFGFENIQWLHDSLFATEYYSNFKSKIWKILVNLNGILENERNENIKNDVYEALVAEWTCKVGGSSNYSKKWLITLDNWLNHSEKIQPDLITATLSCGLLDASSQKKKEVLNKVFEFEDFLKPRELLKVLAIVEDNEVLNYLFDEISKNDSRIESSSLKDFFFTLTALNSIGLDSYLNYIINNHGKQFFDKHAKKTKIFFNNIYGPENPPATIFNKLIQIQGFCGTELFEQIEGIKKSFEKSVVTRGWWLERNKKDLELWFSDIE